MVMLPMLHDGCNCCPVASPVIAAGEPLEVLFGLTPWCAPGLLLDHNAEMAGGFAEKNVILVLVSGW